MSRLQKILLAALLLLTLGLGLGSNWQQSLQPLGGTVTRLRIAPGMSTAVIGDLLQERKIIRSAWSWRVFLWVRGWKLKAGIYDLDPNQTLGQIAEQLRQGRVVQVRFTIPEGWNLRQMARFFAARQLFPEAQFWPLVRGPQRLQAPWLPREVPQLEGFLFPDTYRLNLDQVSARTVVSLMLNRFGKVALPVYQKSNANLSLVQWATLASIVEKEAVVAPERPVIAGVFTARLKKGMPLGSDPTVEYAFNLHQTPDRPLTYKQVRQPSPYNTYVAPGLPPTPIAASGLASLESAARPAMTDYLYFMARYNGTHIFSRTEAEHEQAKKQVRAQRRQTPLVALP